MSDTKHTPGPWITDTFEVLGCRQRMQVDIGFPNGEPGTLRDHRDANVALVAAAPDLLAACESARSALHGFVGREFADAWDALDAAIRKAKVQP